MPRKCAVDKLVERMASEVSLEKLLQVEGMTVKEVLARLQTPRGRRQWARWRTLARMHGLLQVDKHALQAIETLQATARKEDDALAIKAAVVLLELAGWKPRTGVRSGRRKEQKVEQAPPDTMGDEEHHRLSTALGIGLDVMEGRRTLVPRAEQDEVETEAPVPKPETGGVNDRA